MDINLIKHDFERKYILLTNFYQYVMSLSELPPEMVAESLEELIVAVEELNIAQEELLQQNQEIQYTRTQVEIERQRYQDLFELAPDGYLVTDEFGRIQQANRAAAELFKIPQAFLVGKPLTLFVPSGDQAFFFAKLNQLVRGEKTSEWEICLKTRYSNLIEVAITVSGFQAQENCTKSWLWLIRDISERKRIEAANLLLKQKLWERKKTAEILRQSEADFRSMFEHSPVAYQSLDEQGLILDVNAELCNLLGYTSDELIGKSFGEFWSPEIKPYFSEKLANCKNAEIMRLELELMTKNGELIIVFLESRSQWDENGRFIRTLCILHNITERKRTEDALRQAQFELRRINRDLKHLVNIDSLTEIANRRCFDQVFIKEWQRLQREQQPLSLILFDVDYFKLYNDFYGHQKGDECLSTIAQTVQKAVYRPADLVARYGGEEFAVILPNINREGAIEVANRIHDLILSLKIPHQASPVSDWVTVSFGIACVVPQERSPDLLIQQADMALYQAKQQGRNQYVIAV
ncbi:diguanylate cyclase domain-containing protein [Chroococcus sp. FPU101]|uniref:diguanylate cyclase domain-containing protein n=1 Tax=Chroococcus sp. FPU101 TaxID=1974212 RepID=UPI001A8D5CA2|nr:diguanylate cyclase [Chroococcus sp. FPU101]GFE70589.1 regulatory components of sensory transduction system [Chroococcus sp. FPU101]